MGRAGPARKRTYLRLGAKCRYFPALFPIPDFQGNRDA